MKNLGKTLCIGVFGGGVFSLIQLPLPWTLGPIAAISLYSLWRGEPLYWPLKVRNIALILLGYAMGRPFTAATGQAIMTQLPIMAAATGLTILAGLLTAWITYKKTGLSLASCLLGCVPGGLSQMVILADEVEDADQTAVTIMQTMRMLAVVFLVPFLALHVLPPPGPGILPAADAIPVAADWVYGLIAVLGALVGRFLHLPTPYLLGPLLSTAAFTLLSGGAAPLVPLPYINVAQICVGTYIGTSINLAKIKQYRGLGSCLTLGVTFVLLVSLVLGELVVVFTGTSLVTAFLSTAPGGLTEMGITALIVGADISTMTAYQLVRLLFIMLFVPFMARKFIEVYTCRSRQSH